MACARVGLGLEESCERSMLRSISTLILDVCGKRGARAGETLGGCVLRSPYRHGFWLPLQSHHLVPMLHAWCTCKFKRV